MITWIKCSLTESSNHRIAHGVLPSCSSRKKWWNAFLYSLQAAKRCYWTWRLPTTPNRRCFRRSEWRKILQQSGSRERILADGVGRRASCENHLRYSRRAIWILTSAIHTLRVPSASSFQRLMDRMLHELKWNDCLCYMDDILVFGSTFEEHQSRLNNVLSALGNAGLVLNAKNGCLEQKRLSIYDTWLTITAFALIWKRSWPLRISQGQWM